MLLLFKDASLPEAPPTLSVVRVSGASGREAVVSSPKGRRCRCNERREPPNGKPAKERWTDCNALAPQYFDAALTSAPP
ncbi:hypothetical protein [uncultured Nostoc sp.]|uniref:hypothetical protein n=1 Tax=uncultured Nostoc sp. TaxID=340711 RepID=UPI0035CAB060